MSATPFYSTSDGVIGRCHLKGSVVKFIVSTRFTKSGRNYQIVSTTSTGRGVYDCIDTVKNDKGEYRNFKRHELINFIEQ